MICVYSGVQGSWLVGPVTEREASVGNVKAAMEFVESMIKHGRTDMISMFGFNCVISCCMLPLVKEMW